jgi:D-beta-D-heptose 7-phosphate kinase/D-beta-D-heptose 1-phosphate adenosyltransferase
MKNIWINGCFDIVHMGHIELFKYAKSLGNKLVVGIDTDDRVRILKGPSRPINNQENRKKFLESIKYIDKVVMFNSADCLVSEIKKNNIDSIVVGDDYRNKQVIGSEYVDKVIFFPKIPNLSTSRLLNNNEQQ